MLLSVLTFFQEAAQNTAADSRYELATMPVHQFRWWIILCFLAFHGVIAVIVTELMTRSYGKWYIWLAIALAIPVFGPVMIYLWHLGMAGSTAGTRKSTFWERVLYTGPVSLGRILLREKELAQETELFDIMSVKTRTAETKDIALEQLLNEEKFAEARAQAWRMMEIAKDTRDNNKMAQYREYLELIAERESLASGLEL